MKNAIVLIIDSISYESIVNHPLKDRLFINELIKNHYSCSNMYSEGPFTESAVNGLLCGVDNIKYESYMYRFLNYPKTIFEAFKEYGYETYYSGIESQYLANTMTRGVDHYYYDGTYKFDQFWNNRLLHYSKLHKKHKLDKEDWNTCYRLVDYYFHDFFELINQYETNAECVSLIIDRINLDKLKDTKELLKKEYACFNNNKHVYVDKLLNEGEKSTLAKTGVTISNKKPPKDKMEEYLKYATEIETKAKELNKSLNSLSKAEIRSDYLKVINQFIRHPSTENFRSVRHFKNYEFDVLNEWTYDQMMSENYYFRGPLHSFEHLSNHLIQAYEKSEKPFFGVLHFGDVHFPSLNLTTDYEYSSELYKEYLHDMEFLNNCPKDIKGNIRYYLSIWFIDYKIKQFIEKLKQSDKYKDTTIVITADHGCSLSYNPKRYASNLGLFKESIHVPFIVIDNDLKHEINDNFYVNYHIPSTLLKLATGKDSYFRYKSIFEVKNDHCILKYPGNGCPDLKHKKIKYAYIDSKNELLASAKLSHTVKSKNIDGLYNLDNDSLLEHNIQHKRNKTKQTIVTHFNNTNN